MKISKFDTIRRYMVGILLILSFLTVEKEPFYSLLLAILAILLYSKDILRQINNKL